MSDAIEVLKKYSTSCSVCKYNGGDQCKASGGEFGECRSAEELSKAINEALLALEQKEKINEIIKREKYWINKILNNPKDYEKDKVSEAWFKDQLIKKLEGVEK